MQVGNTLLTNVLRKGEESKSRMLSTFLNGLRGQGVEGSALRNGAVYRLTCLPSKGVNRPPYTFPINLDQPQRWP